MVTGHEFWARSPIPARRHTATPSGQRVSGEGHIVCGKCRNCRAGRGQSVPQHRSASASTGPAPSPNICAFRESNVVPIPDDVPDEIAAIFDPFGNAVHTALSLRPRRRGRAGHRRRADRHHGRAGRPARPARARSSSPTSTRIGRNLAQTARRAICRRSGGRNPAARHGPHRHEGGLRCRPRNVGGGAGLPRHDRRR